MNGLLNGRDNERGRQRRFQLSLTTNLHLRLSRSTRAQSSFCIRRSAWNFPRRKSLPRSKHKKETSNVLLLHEKTRICNVRLTSKHFPTDKVDFLTNNVILRTICTMTVSRNATNDVRTESARLDYGSRPMQFPVFGEGRCGREPPYLRNSKR